MSVKRAEKLVRRAKRKGKKRVPSLERHMKYVMRNYLSQVEAAHGPAAALAVGLQIKERCRDEASCLATYDLLREGYRP